MSRSKIAALVAPGIGLLSLGLGIGVGLAFEHLAFEPFALGLIAGLLAGLGSASLYALPAWIFGWARLWWNDLFAVGSLLP